MLACRQPSSREFVRLPYHHDEKRCPAANQFVRVDKNLTRMDSFESTFRRFQEYGSIRQPMTLTLLAGLACTVTRWWTERIVS